MTTSNPTDSRILYIDDNPINRSLVKRLLANYGFEIFEAGTGLEGIALAQENPPHLILMDINMPGLDGHETTTRMRSISDLKDTPIIAVTARTTEGERELALAAGCDGYIPKPIDVDTFPQQIIAYLEGHRDKLNRDEFQKHFDRYSQKLVERLESKLIELQEVNIRLRKIDKMKSDFITLAAHELRTPLAVAYGYADVLQDVTQNEGQTPETFEQVQDLSRRIYESTHRLTEVVNDILNASLINANEMQVVEQPVSLFEVVTSALAELGPFQDERQLDITIDDMDALPFIFGDAKKLQQTFWNLLSNAIKFTPDGGSINVSGTEINPDDDPRFNKKGVLISVKDSGVGISPSDTEAIFEQFYVVGNTTYHRSSKTAYQGGGIGLGLPIAKGVVKAHQGKIWVESAGRNDTECLGSTFHVYLPLNEGLT